MIQEANLTEQTVNHILKMLEKRSLKEGDFFATESELEEKFQISRPVLREAISRIRALGFLESRKRKGLIVSKPDPIKLFEQAFQYGVMSSVDIRELAELRYTIEIGAIDFAALRATEAQLSTLSDLAEEFAETALSENSSRGQDLIELDFHRTLLEASHNTMLIRMHNVLTVFFSRASNELPEWGTLQVKNKGLWEHRAIADALVRRNADQARTILSGHLEELINKEI
ncbi:MAG: FadR family transcriptional regulator [Spirochaetaceae bacterium]|nr:FadR family transcriptional regulator [Spirochaetaceae bacterium]